MVYAVVDRYFLNVERIHSLETSDIEAIQARIGSSEMMRIDAAHGAEKMLRGIRVELIDGKRLFPFRDSKAIEGRRRDDCAAAPAHRTVAMSRINEPGGEVDFKLDAPTMAGSRMDGAETHKARPACFSTELRAA